MLPEQVDPVFVGLLIFIAGLLFFAYLLVRRTVVGFREGVDRGRDR